MIPVDQARLVLQTLLSRGGDFAEIFLESSTGTALVFQNGTLEEASSGTDAGVGLQLVSAERTYFANGNDRSPPALLDLARSLASALPPGGVAGDVPPLTNRRADRFSIVLRDPTAVPAGDKVSFLLRADRAARAFDPRVVQVDARYRDVVRRTSIANSDGVFTSDRIVHTTLIAAVAARDETGIRRAVKAAAGTCGLELFDTESPERTASEAARVACVQLGAQDAPAGSCTVVLSAAAGGTFVHEACGHGLEADFVHKGLSVYGSRIGRQVASERITVVDDGTLAGRRGTYGVDDEGTPSQRTVLIERGVLLGLMHSRRTARLLDMPPTGNGRRESYRHLPEPRMRNTLIEPGSDDPGAILASVEDGLWVADMGGGEVDIVTGNFVFHCTEAYRIRNGRIAEPVRDAILTGNGPEVLMTIDRVGSDLGYQVGTCGKNGQGVPVADAQPTLRIPGLVVGGRAR